MPRMTRDQNKASVAALLLVTFGVLLGIAVDRVVLGWVPTAAVATPLTVDAMADELELDEATRSLVQQRIDSLGISVARAVEKGPDSLRVAALQAQCELESVLPADRRRRFNKWLEERRMSMSGHMGMMGGSGHDSMHPPGAGAGLGDSGVTAWSTTAGSICRMN